MSNVINSPFMTLPVPIVGQAPGPEWAQDINNCLTIIDQHDHSSGSGVQINPSGLNINSDLPINDNNLTTIRSSRYYAQNAALGLPADLACTYVVGVDLYFNDGNGNIVRITQGGAVTGAAGNISGLVSPASASYSAGSQTFIWQSNVNTPANMDAASYIFRNNIASSKGLTLEPPAAMGTDYALVLPAPVGATAFLTLDSSGNISGSVAIAQGITGSMIASNTIALRSAATRNYTTDGSDPGAGGIVSAPQGTFTAQFASYTAVGAPITLTTIGKTVDIWMDADGTTMDSFVTISGSTGPASYIGLFRDGVIIKSSTYNNAPGIFYPAGSFRWSDINAPAGVHVYQLAVISIGNAVSSSGCVLVAKEVG